MNASSERTKYQLEISYSQQSSIPQGLPSKLYRPSCMSTNRKPQIPKKTK